MAVIGTNTAQMVELLCRAVSAESGNGAPPSIYGQTTAGAEVRLHVHRFAQLCRGSNENLKAREGRARPHETLVVMKTKEAEFQA